MSRYRWWTKWQRFRRRSWFERLWLLPVWVLLGGARLTVLIVPGRRLLVGLGRDHDGQALSLLVTAAECQRAERIGRTIRSAAHYTPWRSNCLAQALVARQLLTLYGVPHVLFFGLARSGMNAGRLEAHAWVMVGPVAVTGGNAFPAQAVVGVFSRPRPVGGGVSLGR